MATLRTGQTTDFSNQGTEFQVTSQDTDGATLTETYYIPNFAKWNGRFYLNRVTGKATFGATTLEWSGECFKGFKEYNDKKL